MITEKDIPKGCRLDKMLNNPKEKKLFNKFLKELKGAKVVKDWKLMFTIDLNK